MKRQHYNTFTQLLTAGFFFCGIIPIFIIGTTSIYTSKQMAVKELEQTASQVVQHRQNVINNFLDHQMERFSTITMLYPLEYLQQQEHLNRLFLTLSKSGNLVDVQIIDTNGDPLTYVGPFSSEVKDKNFKDQSWFAETLVRGTYVSDIFTGYRSTPHFVIALIDPLKQYILRATINSGAFNALLHSTQLDFHGEVFIVNKRGELQAPSLQGQHNSLTEEELQLIRPHSGISFTNRGEHLYASTWLNHGEWLLLLKMKTDDMLGSYQEHLLRVVAVIAITALIFFIISIGLSRFIVARIAKADQEAADLDQHMAHIEKMANIGRLAAGVAHEINNPLQMILSQASWLDELLQDEDPTCLHNLEEYNQTVGKIKQHVSRASKITHRLLGFSRKISEEQVNVQINDLVEETLSFLDKEAQRSNIKINLLLDQDLPTTMTEGNRLQQVLLNLIENALDAVEQDGKVDIRTSHDDKTIRIDIGDNGPGIEVETLNKIWNPFFTTKAQGKGTGLGLSISQNIVHSLGGTLEAENKPDGTGAIFTVKIPINSMTPSTLLG